MKINAICVVKNEADIIEETLLNAMKFCHRIYLFDNHCDDGTREIVQSMADRFKQIVIAVRSDETFRHQLRNRVYNMYHHLYDENDWWYLADASELLNTSPRPLLEKALSADKNLMDVWQANFYFTDEDLKHYGSEDKSQTVTERRRYYSINWREARFFRNDPYQKWPENAAERIPPWAGKKFHQAPVCRRYAQRTPEQIEAGHAVMSQNSTGNSPVKQLKKNALLRQASTLHRYTRGSDFTVTSQDKLHIYLKTCRVWLHLKFKALADVFTRQTASNKVESAVQLTKGH